MKILALSAASDRPEAALLTGLVAAGHEVQLMGTPKPAQRELFARTGVVVREFSPKSRFDFAASKVLRQSIAEWKPDIVHAFSGRTLAAAVRVKNKNTSFSLVTYRGTVGHLSRLDPGSLCSFLNSKVDAISCVSNAVHNYLFAKGVPEEKLRTIYKGHNPEWYTETTRVQRADFGIPHDHIVIVCIANDRPVKGLDVFIRAANLLAGRTNLSFLVVGTIKDKGLETLSQNSNLKFLGFRSDAQALIGLVDCLVVPSRGREGLPKALLEAMAQKKAVIASSVGGIPEVLENEKSGLLIPPNDPRLLADAIQYVAGNDSSRFELGVAGFKRLQQAFSVDNMLKQTLDLYSELNRRRN